MPNRSSIAASNVANLITRTSAQWAANANATHEENRPRWAETFQAGRTTVTMAPLSRGRSLGPLSEMIMGFMNDPKAGTLVYEIAADRKPEDEKARLSGTLTTLRQGEARIPENLSLSIKDTVEKTPEGCTFRNPRRLILTKKERKVSKAGGMDKRRSKKPN